MSKAVFEEEKIVQAGYLQVWTSVRLEDVGEEDWSTASKAVVESGLEYGEDTNYTESDWFYAIPSGIDDEEVKFAQDVFRRYGFEVETVRLAENS